MAAQDAPALRRNLNKLYLIRGLFAMHFFGPVLVPFFQGRGHLSLSQIFQLNAWFYFVNFLLEAPTGAMADRLGRRVSLMAGGVVMVAAALMFGFATTMTAFLVAEAAFALGTTLQSGADEALAVDMAQQPGWTMEVSAVLAKLESFKLTGILVAAVSGSWIAHSFGLNTPFFFYGGAALMVVVVGAGLKEPSHASGARHAKSMVDTLKIGWKSVAHDPVARMLVAEMAITNALAWGIIWLFQPLLQRASVPLVYFGLIQAGVCLAQVGFLSRVQGWEKRLGSKRTLIALATLAGGLAFVALAFCRAPWLVILVGLPAYAFTLPRIALYSAAINERFDSAHRATSLSFASMVRTLAIAVCNPVLGWIADRSLSGALLVIGGGLSAAAGLAFLRQRTEN